jgi:PAS domain S-box-containing protein
VHQLELEMQNRELRDAQAAMEESREKLADLYDHAPVVYLTMDERTRILEANLTASALFGIARPQLFGTFLTSLVVDRDRRALREHVRRASTRARGSKPRSPSRCATSHR